MHSMYLRKELRKDRKLVNNKSITNYRNVNVIRLSLGMLKDLCEGKK